MNENQAAGAVLKTKPICPLGKLPAPGQERDAVHVAIFPAIAVGKLAPGQDVGFVDNAKTKVGVCDKPIGIIDPYLTSLVYPDQNVWVCLYPNSITSMTHRWEHPEFEPVHNPSDAIAWITGFAKNFDMSYVELMEAADNFLKTGEYITQHDSTRWRDAMYDSGATFWKHYQIVTGQDLKTHDEAWVLDGGGIFTCNC